MKDKHGKTTSPSWHQKRQAGEIHNAGLSRRNLLFKEQSIQDGNDELPALNVRGRISN